MTYQSEVLADSPLLYWRLGETSGTTAADTSGNGRTGTYNGGPTLGATSLLVSDAANKAVTLDGINDYVSGAAPATTSAFTIEFWAEGFPSGSVFATRYPSTSSQRIFFVGFQSGKVYFDVRNAVGAENFFLGATTLGAGARHIVCTYDGAASKIYVDGVLDATDTSVTGALSSSAPALEIGARTAASAFMAGTFDEVALYGTALSAARILAHYNAGSVAPAPQTVVLDAAPTTGGAFGINVQHVPAGTVISRRIGRRLTASPQVRVSGVWLATVGAAGDLVVQHKRNGCYEASWSMALGRQERPSCLVKGAPVEIYYGPLLVWTGTLDAPDWNAGTFAAIGSSREGEGAKCLTGAGVVTSKPNTAINAAISRGVVDWIRVGDFGTDDLSGVEGDGSNDDPDIEGLNGLLDVWATENDSQWYVTPDRQLIIRPEDENAPKWFILPGTVVLGVAADDVTDRVFLRYRSSVDDYLRTVSYPASTPVGGIERSASIAKRGRMSSARALTIATAMYRRLQAGRTGWTNGIDAHYGQVIDKGGLVANLALIRGGDTVRVLDHPDPRGVVRHVDLVIGEVTWTPEENRVQLNPVGLAARTWESVMKQSRALAINGPEYSFETTY